MNKLYAHVTQTHAAKTCAHTHNHIRTCCWMCFIATLKTHLYVNRNCENLLHIGYILMILRIKPYFCFNPLKHFFMSSNPYDTTFFLSCSEIGERINFYTTCFYYGNNRTASRRWCIVLETLLWIQVFVYFDRLSL